MEKKPCQNEKIKILPLEKKIGTVVSSKGHKEKLATIFMGFNSGILIYTKVQSTKTKITQIYFSNLSGWLKGKISFIRIKNMIKNIITTSIIIG